MEKCNDSCPVRRAFYRALVAWMREIPFHLVGRTPLFDVHCDFGRCSWRLPALIDPIEIKQRSFLPLPALEMDEDHEDDCRKAAALERGESSRGQRNPVASAGAVVNRILPLSSSADFVSPASASVQMELPFLVTHYLANFRPREGSHGTAAAPRADPRHDPEEEAAVERIRKAATELADAFEALGAFGTALRVRGLDINQFIAFQ
jgi:hypothetical protein